MRRRCRHYRPLQVRLFPNPVDGNFVTIQTPINGTKEIEVFDLVGNEINAGKTLGTDLEKGKLTLPLLNLISSGTDTQKEKLNEMILLKEPIDTNVLAGIADYDGAIERALNTGKSLISDSRNLLNPLDNSPYKTALIQITNYLEKLFSDCH